MNAQLYTLRDPDWWPDDFLRRRRRDFDTARRFRDDEFLMIGVGMVPDRYYRVRVGRIRQWEAERNASADSRQ